MASFQLNPQQQEAVDTLDGALLLLAGAGTGKTRVIVERIGNMMAHGIPSDSILAVTFTNKAAREMQERVLALPGMKPGEEPPKVCTFHSFCSEILRHHANLLGFTRKFTLATEGYQKGLLREIVTELKLGTDHIDPYTWLSRISLAKAYMQTPSDMAKASFPDAPRISAIYARYQERLKRMDMMDFDDLLGMTVRLFQEHPDILQGYRDRFRFLMIDEYQDTNTVQLQLMVLLAGECANICAVGDDDQSIYGWRGASQDNILAFESYFPRARVIRLEQNYRSTNTILKAANALISANKNRRVKNLWSSQGDGEKLTGIHCGDEHEEAEFVAENIYNQSLKGNSLITRDRDWTRYAVLFRTGSQSRLLEDAFRKRHVPFVLVGSKSFYQRKEILDLITLLELVVNPRNDMALQRVINVPPRGVGDATLDKLTERGLITRQSCFDVLSEPDFISLLSPEVGRNLADFTAAVARCAAGSDEPGPVLPRIRLFLQDLQYVERLIYMYKPRSDALARKDNVMEFLNSVAEYDEITKGAGTLGGFIEELALKDANDRRDKDRDVTENAVTLMTIHASKGLEFPVVYLVGMEQGLFPHTMAMEEGNLEEERRLCYVAITRAKQKLYLTYADKRHVMNLITVKRPSMFLDEIPEEFIEYLKPADFRKKAATSAEDSIDFLEQIKARLSKF